MSLSNAIPKQSCVNMNMQSENEIPELVGQDCSLAQVTAPVEADASIENNKPTEEDLKTESAMPLREKNCRKTSKYNHVPHKDKPPQVVARRNARERKRVQAVNNAFMRLRNVIPIENSGGKRVSKLKTLQFAIEYINHLEELLQRNRTYGTFDNPPTYCFGQYQDFMGTMEFVEEF